MSLLIDDQTSENFSNKPNSDLIKAKKIFFGIHKHDSMTENVVQTKTNDKN